MKERTNQPQEVFETKTGKIWQMDNDTLIFETMPGANILLEDSIEHIEIASKITKSKKWVMLVDMREVNSVTKEARTYYSDQNVIEGRVAIALLIESYFSQIVANFFIAYSKPDYPIKLFVSKEKAIEWLKDHLK